MKKTKLLALFGSICLVLALVVSLSSGLTTTLADTPKDELPPGLEKRVEPAEAEISFIDGAPIPPGARPVIILSGSDYDMGYQYYQQLVQVFGPWCLERMSQEFTEEQILALKANQWYISVETPEMIDFVKGMADGATDAGVELSYMEVLASFTGTTTRPDAPPGSEDDKLPPKDCSGFAVWGSATTDGKLICAGSGDHDLIKRWRPELTLIFFPEEGNSIICAPPTGGIAHPAMNNKGLAYVHHGATLRGDWLAGYGIPGLFAILHTLRFADDAIEAVDMQLGYTSSSHKSNGGLWADVDGNAFIIECSDPLTIRVAGDYGEVDFIYAANNSLTEEFEEWGLLNTSYGWELRYVEHGGWHGYSESSVQRNLGMWNMFHNYQGEIDIEFAKMMWRFAAELPDYPTLEEAEIGLYELQGEGWDMKICSQENAMVGVLIPDDGDEGLYYVSQGCATKVTAPLGGGEHFYRVAPTYSFYELKLASSPGEVVDAAKLRAQFDLWDANVELGKLTYWDVPYVPVNEIFSQAAAEWINGCWHMDLAKETTGNESIYNWGKSLRAFTACQAYAKQAYNALVPPPDSPEDLGLQDWFGEWGEWAEEDSN